MPTDYKRMEKMLREERTCIVCSTYEEEYALELVRAAAQAMKLPLWVWTAGEGVSNGLFADGKVVPHSLPPAGALTWMKGQREPAIFVVLDLITHLDDAIVLRCLRDLTEALRRRGGTLIMIDQRSNVPSVIGAYATPFELSLPDEVELDSLIRETLRSVKAAGSLEIQLKRRDYEALLKNLRGLSRRQVRRIVRDVVGPDHKLTGEDINKVLAEKRRTLQTDGLLEFVETPTDLTQVGGLKRLKSWLALRDISSDKRAEDFGLVRPRGVLLLGVQGAGKSLCAKAIATAWSRPLLRLDPGALYDRYVGESERRLRDSLRQAETMAPIVLWVDEIEKGFSSAASHSVDGGLSKRMFGTLLTWMQEHTAPVFMVATANDIEALPPELLRKGRFDEIFFVDLPTAEARKQIFSIHLARRKRDPATFDLDALVAASDGFSGAEIEQAVIAGLYTAYGKNAPLDTPMLCATLRDAPPLSVTMAEKVAALREWAQGRCVPAE